MNLLKKIYIYIGILLFSIGFLFIIDIYLTFSQLKQHNNIFAILYILFFVTILVIIVWFLLKFYIEFKRYSVIDDNTKENFNNFKDLKSEKQRFLLKKILFLIKNSNDIDLQNSAQEIFDKLNSNTRNDILKDELDKLLLNLNDKAKSLIKEEALNVTVITAISQKNFLDIIITLFKNISLIRKILRLYGYKTNPYTTLMLSKKALENVMTAGAIEQMDNMINGMNIATSFLGGITNGILLLRVGNAAVQSLSLITTENINIKKFVDYAFETTKKNVTNLFS